MVLTSSRYGLRCERIALTSAAASDAPSYFIECLLYNVPDKLLKSKLAPTYTGILGWLKTAKLGDFQCQNRNVALFGSGQEQWSANKAQAFVKALRELWEAGG